VNESAVVVIFLHAAVMVFPDSAMPSPRWLILTGQGRKVLGPSKHVLFYCDVKERGRANQRERVRDDVLFFRSGTVSAQKTKSVFFSGGLLSEMCV
jgi:hypothetical protein